MIGLVDKDAHLWTSSNCEFIIWSKWRNNPPTEKEIFFNTAQSLVVSVGERFSFTKEAASLHGLFFAAGVVPKCFSFYSPRSLSLLSCLGATGKTVLYVYLVLTNGPWVLTAEPLRFVLPLKVRKEEKGAESPLGRVQLLQRNEESFHHVSCKPVMVPRERERNREVMVSLLVSLNQRTVKYQ